MATFVLHLSAFAQSSEGIATLSNIIGKVDVVRSGKTITAEKGFVLLETDELITYDKTAAKIVFNDGSNLMAFQNARVKVVEYKIKAKSENTNDVKSAIDVIKGKVRFFVKPQDDSDAEAGKTDAKFKTSNSVMGIRGTSGFIDASVPNNTQIIVTSGLVQVTSIDDPSKSVLVPANKFTEVVGRRPPTLPKAVPPIILNKLNSDASTVDPNFKNNEKSGKNENTPNKNNQNNQSPSKQGNESGSTTPSGAPGGLAGTTNNSQDEITSAVIDQRKTVFNPDGTSGVISTNSSLNALLESQGNTTVRPTSTGDFDPIKKSLDQVNTTTTQINRQISSIIQTVATPQVQKSITIIINNPNLP
ncbi:hypothetical protein AXG55_08605 [Silvanigrella aquatica]|uniref:FecR protein domain-containing protein n=1 Tax=Silvanigrella aquatica TaxID=1915309 RepID=A0A1L4D183_9BACT|nr:hypothetical protein AXG55_08605 [Silvanigrella aquatica]